MNHRPKLKRGEWLWMVLPILALAGFAIALRGRNMGHSESRYGPVTFTVEEVIFRRLPANSANNWRMQVTVYVGQHGPTPEWWGKPGYGFCLLDKLRFKDRNGKVSLPFAYGGGGGNFDEQRQQYWMQYRVNTGKKRTDMQPATFTALAVIKDWTTGRAVVIPISKPIKDSW